MYCLLNVLKMCQIRRTSICVCFIAFLLRFSTVCRSQHTRPSCNYEFKVWEPDVNINQQIRMLETKFDNLSNYIDKEILRQQGRWSDDIQRCMNWTINLERSITDLKILQLQKISESSDTQGAINRCDVKIKEMNDRFDEFILYYADKKHPRRKHGRKDRMLPSTGYRSQADNPRVYMTDILKHMVSDMKAEWILMKRDLLDLRNKTQTLVQGQNDLNDITAKMDETQNKFKQTIQSLKSMVATDKDIENIKTHIETLKQDFAGLKAYHEEMRGDVLTTENGITALQATAMGFKQDIAKLQTENDYLREKVSSPNDGTPTIRLPYISQQQSLKLQAIRLAKDCTDIVEMGYTTSGSYQVKPAANLPLDYVYCDVINQTGYTTIQRRTDGLQNFNRGWLEYKIGFGNLYGEFWAGNEFLHALTKADNYGLRVDIWDWEGQRTFAEYDVFTVGDEESKYKLHVSGYHGNAGDSLSYHDNMKFSTEDMDNDMNKRNCAADNKGGWWYNSCYFSQLNGVYHVGWYSQTKSPFADGIVWYLIKDSDRYSLRKVEMKLKRHA